jgi:hypothetical protein
MSHSDRHLGKLFLIQYGSGSIQHWGIGITVDNAGNGVSWDVIFDDEARSSITFCGISIFPRHGSKKKYICKRRNFNVEREREKGRGCMFIQGAVSTLERIEAATERVMRDFKYKLVSENCQTFAILVLETLRRWDPEMVTDCAIKLVARGSAPTVRLATTMRQKRDMKQTESIRPVYLAGNGQCRTPSRPHFTSSESPSQAETSLRFSRKPMRSSRNTTESYGSSAGNSGFGINMMRDAEDIRDQQWYAGRRDPRYIATDPPYQPISLGRRRDARQVASEPPYQMPGGWVD